MTEIALAEESKLGRSTPPTGLPGMALCSQR
jgi:hypothetical protein